MKARIIFLISLIYILDSSAQTDPFWTDFEDFPSTTLEAQNQQVFGQLDPSNYPTFRIYDRTDYASKALQMDGFNLVEILNYGDWLTIYNEMDATLTVPSSFPNAFEVWRNARSNYHSSPSFDGSLTVPVGIINLNYHKLKEYAFDDNLILIQGESLIDNPNASENPFEQKRVFAAAPLIDTILYPSVKFKIDTDFYFSNVCNVWQSLKIDFGDGNGLVTVATGQTYTINYTTRGDKNIYFELTCNGQILKNYAKLHVVPDPYAPFSRGIPFPFYSEALLLKYLFRDSDFDDIISLERNGITGKMGIIYGCGNTSIRKPIMFVSGFNPFSATSLGGYLKYDNNGIITDLLSKGFDICILRPDRGADFTSNSAFLVQEAIEYLNEQKALSGSNIENILIGFSYGALINRLALARMEEDFFENGGPYHHTKLFISHDGEHQGASVPLGYQHALESIKNFNAGLGFCDDLLELMDFVGVVFFEGDQLLNSNLAREILLNHFTVTGTPNAPANGPFSTRQTLLNLYESISHPYTKVNGYPAFVRNVALSKGAKDGSSQPGYSPGDDLYRIDRVGDLGIFGRRQRMIVRSIDAGDEVFVRQVARKVFFGGWRRILDERFQVSNDAVPIENATGSELGIGKGLNQTLSLCTFTFSPEVKLDVSDNFVPVISALDIRNHNGNPNYNVQANNLLFIDPNTENRYRYPHLKYVNPYQITPFDAVLCMDMNNEHGVNTDPEFDFIKRFFVIEISPDTLELQNQRIGQYINNYQVDYEATNLIKVGKELNFRSPYGNFIIENQSEVKLRAGNAIIFEPGTSIETGSTVSAEILVPPVCNNLLAPFPSFLIKTSDSDKSNLTVEASENKSQFLVEIYPNPSNGHLNIRCEQGIYDIKIVDLLGRIIYDNCLKAEYSTFETSVDIAQQGIYIVQIRTTNHIVQTYKISIQP